MQRIERRYRNDTSLDHSDKEEMTLGAYREKARRLFEEEKISEGHYNALMNLIEEENHADGTDNEITPFVASLCIGTPTTEDDESLKQDYIDYLDKKYN